MFVTIDPGAQTGWAIWSPAGALVDCGLGDPRKSSKHIADDIDTVWIESQVIYPRSRVPPNDIVKLAQDAGRWFGVYATLGAAVNWVEPARWKGQLPKRVHHPRIMAALTSHERQIVAEGCCALAESLRHNVLDAVGLGLWVRSKLKK